MNVAGTEWSAFLRRLDFALQFARFSLLAPVVVVAVLCRRITLARNKQTQVLHSKRVTMGLVSFTKVILPAFAGSCVVSYAFWDLARNRKIFGGTVPHTIQGSEWEKETNKKLDAWPREAAGPVVMNPISRQNYHKT